MKWPSLIEAMEAKVSQRAVRKVSPLVRRVARHGTVVPSLKNLIAGGMDPTQAALITGLLVG